MQNKIVLQNKSMCHALIGVIGVSIGGYPSYLSGTGIGTGIDDSWNVGTGIGTGYNGSLDFGSGTGTVGTSSGTRYPVVLNFFVRNPPSQTINC